MLFFTHILFGLLIALLFKSFLPEINYWLFLFLVLLGSIFPDIDEPNSKIVNWSGFIGKIISFFSHHRGFFHSLFFILLISLILNLFLSIYYLFGLVLGLFSHLFLDSLTKQGIVLFYPLPYFKLKGWMVTGGIIEWLIRLIFLVLIIYLL